MTSFDAILTTEIDTEPRVTSSLKKKGKRNAFTKSEPFQVALVDSAAGSGKTQNMLRFTVVTAAEAKAKGEERNFLIASPSLRLVTESFDNLQRYQKELNTDVVIHRYTSDKEATGEISNAALRHVIQKIADHLVGRVDPKLGGMPVFSPAARETCQILLCTHAALLGAIPEMVRRLQMRGKGDITGAVNYELIVDEEIPVLLTRDPIWLHENPWVLTSWLKGVKPNAGYYQIVAKDVVPHVRNEEDEDE